MGNGVKEGAVRLREDAEALLPAPVSSKASTPRPHERSHGSLSCACVPITGHSPHTLGWGCISVRPCGELLIIPFLM